jgi:osmotically-inducible protein OsmY
MSVRLVTEEGVVMKTDLQLQHEVQEELRWDPRCNAAAIGATVTDGIVTLSGQVATFAEKTVAAHAAQRVAGVKGVANELAVSLPALHERTDGDIVRAAVNILAWNTFVPKDQVKVTVQHGWITLEGEVDWHYQKVAAEDAVHALLGVRGVTNAIVVKPGIGGEETKAQICAAFRRHAFLQADHIEVEVVGQQVVLSGSVHSWQAREEADAVAWAAPGVYEVENRLIVAAA